MIRHLTILAALVVCTTASAIQPSDLPSIGPVVHGGGDADFLAALPSLNALYSNSAPSATAGSGFFDFGSVSSGWTLRVYFLSKEAAFPDAIGMSTTAGDATAGRILFANTTGLATGDYVQVNNPTANSFFAITGSDASGGDVWWSDPSFNSDHLSHLQAAVDTTTTTAASWWYAVALDDEVGGGDRDWNDVRLAFHFTAVTAPEPATWALLVGFAAVAAWLWRRRSATV